MKKVWMVGIVIFLASRAMAEWEIELKFQSKPEVQQYPDTSVYYVEGETLYYYGGLWFLFKDGEWYESESYNGPWRETKPSDVPSEVLDVHTMRFPPPPSLETEPRLVIFAGTNVYYWPEGGIYRFGPFWYMYVDGVWYRAPSYMGPWFPVGIIFVPEPVRIVHKKRKIVYSPGLVEDRETRVYYVGNAHIYRYGDGWYYYRNGRWYRGRSRNGPWIRVDIVPDVVIRVHRRRTGGPAIISPSRREEPPRRIEPPRREEPPRRIEAPGREKRRR
jgi:hypothetical protein